jgi:hypothetical protein
MTKSRQPKNPFVAKEKGDCFKLSIPGHVETLAPILSRTRLILFLLGIWHVYIRQENISISDTRAAVPLEGGQGGRMPGEQIFGSPRRWVEQVTQVLPCRKGSSPLPGGRPLTPPQGLF